MLLPMALLAAGCLAVGLLPGLIAPALDRAIADWTRGSSLSEATALHLEPLQAHAPLAGVGKLGGALIGLCVAVGIVLWTRLRLAKTSRSVTWGCGYSAPTPRMQYTVTSFSELLVALFRWVVRPKVNAPTIRELFPQSAAYHRETPDSVLNGIVLPATRWIGGKALFFRVFQQGSLQAYLFYILSILVLLLVWPF
jgi:hydrogenase-4 component B